MARRVYGANVLVSTNGLSEEDWLRYRRQGVGGSDVGAILGMSAYSNAFAIWLAKVEGTTKQVGRAAHRGKMCEAWIAEEAAVRNGWKIKRINAILQHTSNPWMLANVDRVITSLARPAVHEIKMISSLERSRKVRDQGILPEHELQVRWYQAVLQLDDAWITYDLPDADPVDFHIQRDLEMEEHMISSCAAFWKLVESGEPPALDGGEDADEYLRSKFAGGDTSPMRLPDEAGVWIAEYESAKKTIAEAEAMQSRAKQMLQSAMGDHNTGLFDGRTVSWKPYQASRISTDALKRELPDIAAQYTVTTESRRFSIK